MRRNVLLLLLFFIAGISMSQPIRVLHDKNSKVLQAKLGILPDKDYSIESLSIDTALQFRPLSDSIAVGYIYWVKISVENPNPMYRNYVVTVSPQLKNSLYYFSPERHKWIESRKDALNNTGARLLGRHLVSFEGKERTAVFVKIDLSGFGNRDRKVKLAISFQQENLAAGHEQNIRIAWFCCLVVLLIFMLNNLYLYFSFRDRTVLYYLITQLGGMVYITGYRWIFVQVLPPRAFNIAAHEKITYYDFNKIIVHLSVVVILFGFIGITRMFLDTKNQLPKLDRLIRISVNIYGVLAIGMMTLNMAGYAVEHYWLPYANLFCALLILLILITGAVAFQRRIPFAMPFLLANGIPLLFMMAIPLSHLIISLQNEENLWIPELVVLTQTLALSIALVARTRAIQNALSVAKMDNQQLEFDLLEADYQAQVNRLEISKINADVESEKVKNDLLKERLEANQRELASSTLYMVQKNELLNHLKCQMQLLSRPNPSTSQGMRAMSSLIDNSALLDSDWKKFKMHFDQVHPNFFEELEVRYPHLTMKETRLYAYLHMKLSHKEIAALLGIDQASVRRAKTRLFKKLAIPETS